MCLSSPSQEEGAGAAPNALWRPHQTYDKKLIFENTDQTDKEARRSWAAAQRQR